MVRRSLPPRPTRTAARAAVAAGLVAVLLVLAGCSAFGRWVEARRARHGPYAIVTPAVAFEIMRDAPQVFVLDLRPPEEFQGPTGHLRNAFNIPLGRLPYRLLEMRAWNGETFLVYCGNDECGLAGMKTLQDSGFKDAMLIRGGIGGWLCGGFPTYVRAGTQKPATARLKPMKYMQLEPDSLRPKYELPVEPPASLPPCGGR
jgi:rhodanese-related sulfurtransferase